MRWDPSRAKADRLRTDLPTRCCSMPRGHLIPPSNCARRRAAQGTAKPFPFIRLKRLQIKEAVLYGSLQELLCRPAIEYCEGEAEIGRASCRGGLEWTVVG